MNQRQQNLQDLLVFALLIAVGVAGRLGQPEWCFTPTAAAAVFAGAYFSRIAIAAIVPLAILAVSDQWLPAYDSVLIMLATYGVMIAPVWLGRSLRGGITGLRLAICGLLPATLFWLVTNFAVWAFHGHYQRSLAGLAACYWAAVPFYRWMLAGDVFYLAVFSACWVIADCKSRVAARQ